MLEYKKRQEIMEILYTSIEHLNRGYNHQIREYIDEGEYHLALDGIADACTKSNTPMPLAMFELFDELATDIDLASDPEFSDLIEFRKSRGMAP